LSVVSVVKQIGVLAVLVAVAGGGYVGWQHFAGQPADAGKGDSPRAKQRPVAVETAVAAYRDLETRVEAVGSTRARQAVEITPLAAGRVVEVAFKAGQSVAAGDMLLRLDDDIQRADLVEAQARVTAAAKALDRARSLRKTSAVADATVDKLVADLAIAQADKDRAARRLHDRTLTAPFAGVVGFSNVEPGARVKEGDIITTLDDLSLLEIEFSLPEGLFGRVRPGQQVFADAAAYPNRVFDGTVESIDSRVEPVSRAFRVRALVANADLALPAGMFMHLSLALDAQRALTVAEEAIVVDGSIAYLFVVSLRDDQAYAERRDVTVGRRAFGIVEILDGVTENETVVTRGVQKVRDGGPVRLPAGKPDSARGTREVTG